MKFYIWKYKNLGDLTPVLDEIGVLDLVQEDVS